MKWIFGIMAAIAVAVFVLAGTFTYVTKYKITWIDSSLCPPKGQYEVTFQSVGEPDFPFGRSHARLVLKNGETTISKYMFDVANDGGALVQENWSVSWEETCAKVTISGEEQSDELFVIYFDGRVERQQLDTPHGEWK